MSSNQANGADQTLDVCGLRCPLPILKAKKALALMQAGAVLTVLTTDHSAPEDFAAFCRQTGHQLCSCTQSVHDDEQTVYQIVVRHR